MSYSFRHSICNEIFEKWSFADTCKAARRAGYAGIEIAPFTLAEDPAAIPAAKRREYSSIMESEGLKFAGLHWLMVSPKGLHVTTPEAVLRERSWRHIHNLIELCSDLGSNGVMVFGSPAQRSTTGGSTRREATDRLIDGLASAAQHAGERGVIILLEALPNGQCDVVTTLEEAVSIVRRINHPAIRTMFDVHNAVDETEPHDVLVDRYFDLIRHIHVNEMDGKHCGAGNYDFKPLLRVLQRRRFTGWVSLEAFDFTPGAERIANESLRHLEAQIAAISPAGAEGTAAQ
jgi:sugar phosphate isomerase/epimerase